MIYINNFISSHSFYLRDVTLDEIKEWKLKYPFEDLTIKSFQNKKSAETYIKKVLWDKTDSNIIKGFPVHTNLVQDEIKD
jgi:hypothetical protein